MSTESGRKWIDKYLAKDWTEDYLVEQRVYNKITKKMFEVLYRIPLSEELNNFELM